MTFFCFCFFVFFCFNFCPNREQLTVSRTGNQFAEFNINYSNRRQQLHPASVRRILMTQNRASLHDEDMENAIPVVSIFPLPAPLIATSVAAVVLQIRLPRHDGIDCHSLHPGWSVSERRVVCQVPPGSLSPAQSVYFVPLKFF